MKYSLLTWCCLLAAISVQQSVVQATMGTINIQGCTEAFVHMQCPDDDILETVDMRFTEVDQGHPCEQDLPPQNVLVPIDLWTTCNPGNDSTDGHMCVYAEAICAGLNNCTFYVSPHLINTKEQPGINSEIIINYKCKPGTKRKGEIAVAALVATLSILSMLTIGGLLIWRMLTQDTSTYADFANDRPPPRTSVTAASTSAANYGSSTAQGAAAGGSSGSGYDQQPSTSTFEEISVELRTPSGDNREKSGEVF